MRCVLHALAACPPPPLLYTSSFPSPPPPPPPPSPSPASLPPPNRFHRIPFRSNRTIGVARPPQLHRSAVSVNMPLAAISKRVAASSARRFHFSCRGQDLGRDRHRAHHPPARDVPLATTHRVAATSAPTRPNSASHSTPQPALAIYSFYRGAPPSAEKRPRRCRIPLLKGDGRNLSGVSIPANCPRPSTLLTLRPLPMPQTRRPPPPPQQNRPLTAKLTRHQQRP